MTMPAIPPDHHGPFAKVVSIAAPALTMADWLQSLNIAKHPLDFHEMNPVLGRHPSEGSVNTYMALATLGSLLAPEAVPQKLRTPLRTAWAALELANVIRNRRIGIGMSLP